jgi:hypothetical protein
LFVDVARGSRDLIKTYPSAAVFLCERIIDGLIRIEHELEEQGRVEEREAEKREQAADAKARQLARRRKA